MESMINVWVVSTCCPYEPDPCLPSVFGTQAEADAYLEKMMRAEWDANEPENEETGAPLPYPGNTDEAQEVLVELLGGEWGRWEITSHTVKIP